MTRKEAVLLASRALALYLVCWGLTEVTFIPQVLLSLRHSLALASGGYTRYTRAYDSVALTFYVVRAVALFATAGWLYKCGSRVEGFFFGTEPATEDKRI